MKGVIWIKSKKSFGLRVIAGIILLLFIIAILKIGENGHITAQEEQSFYVEESGRYTNKLELDFERLSDITISWANGSVWIRTVPTEDNVVRITEFSNKYVPKKERFSVQQKGSELEVKWKDELLVIGFLKANAKNLLIEVPSWMIQEISSLSCTNAIGNLDVTSLNAGEVTLMTMNGAITVENMQAEESTIWTGFGDVLLQNTKFHAIDAVTQNGAVIAERTEAVSAGIRTVTDRISFSGKAEDSLNFHSVSGNIQYRGNALPKQTMIGTVKGDVSLEIPANEGFLLLYECAKDKLHSDFTLPKGKRNMLQYGAGDAQMKLKTTDGEIHIRQLKK